MSRTVSRNASCPCGSGRKFKRCCQRALEHPATIARLHNAVGLRVQAWASEHYGDEVAAAFDEIVGGRDGIVLGDGDLQLIGTWALSERRLPGGGTIALRYAQRADLADDERDIAARIAAARLTLFRVDRVMPDRWIAAYDLTLGERVTISSHDVSRSVSSSSVIVGRLMAGPPAPTLWGPVAVVDRESGSRLSELLQAHVQSMDLEREPAPLAMAMRQASREITALLAPALRESQAALSVA